MFGATAKPALSSFSFGSLQPSSGPGAANSTNSGGLFGQQQKPQGQGLLGSGTQSTSSGGLFGGQSNTQNTGSSGFGASNTTSGGLFGLGNQASGNTSSGGLFGLKPATGQGFGASSSGGGLFGQKPASTGATGGGLFGSSNQQGQQNQQNQQSGGLFGSSNTSNTQGSGGLFGSKPAAPSGGLFGTSQSNTAQKPLFGGSNTSTGGGLFGLSANNNTTSGSGLFGGSSNTGGGLFGSSANTNTGGGLFGGQQQQQNQQQQQQQNQSATQLTSMTRFGDLPPEIKKELQEFDQYISTQHLIATTLNSDLPKHNRLVKSIDSDVSYLHNKISTIKQALKGDSNQLKALKAVNDELTEDIGNIMQLIIQLSTPGTKLSSSFQLNEFFVKKIKHYKEVMTSYENVIKEAEDAIRGLQFSCNDTIGSIYDVVEVVKSQYNVFMELCETLAQVHSEVTHLKR